MLKIFVFLMICFLFLYKAESVNITYETRNYVYQMTYSGGQMYSGVREHIDVPRRYK
jgi:hypothetical protein